MSTVVNFLSTRATLLSSRFLTGCETPSDESCTGGVSAVAAYIRSLTKDDEPTLVIPKLVFETAFVQMHPLEWAVNRLILRHRFRWAAFVAEASILHTNSIDSPVSQRDLSGLQSRGFPLLLTNAVVPARNSWEMYRESVHLDPETGLAAMYITQSDVAESTSQIDSAEGMLHFVAKNNRDNGCTDDRSPYQGYTNETFGSDTSKKDCYLPVVLFLDEHTENFERFISAVMLHEHPPALVVDLSGNAKTLREPHRIGQAGMWVVSYPLTTDDFFLQRVTVSDDHRSIVNVELVERGLTSMPDSIRLSDARYAADIAYMHELAQEAAFNDPVTGHSDFMPLTMTSEAGNYRACFGGECPLGNLFSDALRWKAGSDVAFMNSGGIRGPGWPAGPVRVSDVWESLPWPNTLCTGTMSGLSLFKVMNYSTSVADFQPSMTDNGNRLLQVSGLRVVYNTNWRGSRLVSLGVWDRKEQQYRPVERSKLYKFATDSWLCSGMHPFPALLGKDLVIQGEVPGRISSELHQSLVSDFLRNTTTTERPYNTSYQGRLMNVPGAVQPPLDLILTANDCTLGTYWDPESMTCLPCLESSNVVFSDDVIAFHGDWGSEEIHFGRSVLINRELFEVGVQPRNSPSFVNLTSLELSNSSIRFDLYDGSPIHLKPAESLAVLFNVSAFGLQSGTASESIAFSVLGGDEHENCVGRDLATLPVRMTVTPSPEKNQLGNFRFVGVSMMAVAIGITIFFGFWIQHHRKRRMVVTMQPFFLFAISVGLVVVELAIVPISIDDQIASEKGCDIACMSIPWLLSMGFTVIISAVFTKLWRINSVFNAEQFRRVTVRERDVLPPFAVMFTLNFILLLSWTLADPMVWERLQVNDQTWSSYGTCLMRGATGKALFVMVGVVNVGALLLAGVQAYKARNIPDEFSESKNLGMALFSWLQLLVVGLPVIALIDGSNATAKYFIYVSLIFALCIFMMVFIFLPILVTYMRQKSGMRESSMRASSLRMSNSPRRMALTTVNNTPMPLDNAGRRSSSCISCGSLESKASVSSNSNIQLLRKLEREKQQELVAIQNTLVQLKNDPSSFAEIERGSFGSRYEEYDRSTMPPAITSVEAIRRASVRAMEDFSRARRLTQTLNGCAGTDGNNHDKIALEANAVAGEMKDQVEGDNDNDNDDINKNRKKDENPNSNDENPNSNDADSTHTAPASTTIPAAHVSAKSLSSHHQTNNSTDSTSAGKGKDDGNDVDNSYNKLALISHDMAFLMGDTIADTLLMRKNGDQYHDDHSTMSKPKCKTKKVTRFMLPGSQATNQRNTASYAREPVSQEFSLTQEMVSEEFSI